MTTATAVTLTVTTYGGTTSQSGSSAATDGVTTASSTVSTATPVTTTTTPVPSQSEGSNSKSNTPAYSSGVYSIAHQSALSNAVVFVPVLVAFLLGAVLYRVSTKGRAGSEKD